MRTTQELHIALDILLQKISSNWNKNFLPQEKDWFINNEINKFIKQRLSPLSNDKQQGIFDILKRTQDLNCLLTTSVIEGVQLNKEVYVGFPLDYLFYISSNGYVSCSSNIKTINIKESRFSKFVNTSTITGLLINITYPDINGSLLSRTIFNLNDLPDDYIPQDDIPSYKKDFIFNNAVLNILNKNLENLNRSFTPTVISKNEEDVISKDIQITYDKSTEQFLILGNFTQLTIIRSSTTGSISLNFSSPISYNVDEINIATDKENEVRVIDEEVKKDILNSYLSKPKDASICGLLREKALRLPKVNGVIIKGAKVTYLRQPRKIDLLLGIDSELPDWILDEVVSKAAETMQGVIGSDTYEKFVRENMLIE
jgi:hypothetical protein